MPTRIGTIDMVGLRPYDEHEMCWIVTPEDDDDIEEWASRARQIVDGEVFCCCSMADWGRDYDVVLFLHVSDGQLDRVRAQVERCVDDDARKRMETQVCTLMPGHVVPNGSRNTEFDMIPTGVARDEDDDHVDDDNVTPGIPSRHALGTIFDDIDF